MLKSLGAFRGHQRPVLAQPCSKLSSAPLALVLILGRGEGLPSLSSSSWGGECSPCPHPGGQKGCSCPHPHPRRGKGLPSPSSSWGEVLPLSSSWGKGWAPLALILLGVKGSPRPRPHPGGGGFPSPSSWGGMGSPHTRLPGRGVGFPSLLSSRGVRAPLALALGWVGWAPLTVVFQGGG